jgi:FKBP-type peptidyl-prolyl cis-trans isomerase (trigger factor)
MSNESHITFDSKFSELNKQYKFTIEVSKEFVSDFFEFAAIAQQKRTSSPGFKNHETPLEYIKEHYKKNILTHTQEIILKYFVLDYLFEMIHERKLMIVGEPELKSISMNLDQNAIYTFTAQAPHELFIQSWKNLPFKATQRKKYRDIDNQVTYFLSTEEENYNAHKHITTVQVGDWVCFNALIVNDKNLPVFKQGKTSLWLKIGQEEPDKVFLSLFINRSIGDTFVTDNPSLQHYFCELFDTAYVYMIEIVDILPHSYFSIEHLKHHFKLKTKKDLHNKLIEIFSFNSDISQRRTMAHGALDIIISKNNITIDAESIKKHQFFLIQDLQQTPDYNVYKMDNRFQDRSYDLAEKQLVEKIIADHIAYQENLLIQAADIKSMLSLLQRNRTKEFLYFPFLETKHQGQETPVSLKQLYRSCLREKAVNHIIHHLTK